jgi:hypothetical protein
VLAVLAIDRLSMQAATETITITDQITMVSVEVRFMTNRDLRADPGGLVF